MDSEELQNAYATPEYWVDRSIDKPILDIRNSYERVKEFHETFGHPVADAPVVPEDDRRALRLALILEEVTELAEALGFDTAYLEYATKNTLASAPVAEPDLVGIADALGDIEYVVNGAALEHGVDLPAVVKEIHRSNMTKLGPDGKPIYREDGKILKGEGYEKPDLEKVLFG